MAEPNTPSIDPKSGFCYKTKTFHTLRPSLHLPPQNLPLSVTSYAISLLPSPPPETTALIDSATGNRLSYPEFLLKAQTLASSLQNLTGLSKGDTVFILAPASLKIPILYYSLLSLGVIVSPANPAGSPYEISRQIKLTRPVIAFASSATAHNLLPLPKPTILLDSPEFESMMIHSTPTNGPHRNVIKQSDAAAILYSSGTTGNVKGVVLTHRNFIALIAGYVASRPDLESPMVELLTVPLFHIFGFFTILRVIALGQTSVLMERFDFVAMLRVVEKFRVNGMVVTPPLVVAMVKSEEVGNYDLSSLMAVGCGGAPLGKEVAEQFRSKLPNVEIVQGYGLTESTGSVTRTIGPEENQHYGSAGRLTENLEAKIVDPVTGEDLSPGQQGELWLRGPTMMKGYIGDDDATASTLDSEGWMKTGDLCYFDHDGFLFIADRLKELIKYKAYQVPPAELEQVLKSHPEIADAAVVPYPDEDVGELPMAFVVRQQGSTLNESQVMDFVAKQVAPYKKIRRVAFINAIPKNPAGKILRRELVSLAISRPSSKL
ncbi:4-coumarate--CoA ligase-like 9 [Tasmannia lanceolata]|uniref:4-coumarate--CoA ligase-like 9 n=1 Tax=Tasmannia lanceolata TaxID=3420 RepID=UPI0040633152